MRRWGTALLFLFVSAPNVSAAIVINEFLPNPASGLNEWVELYNTASENASLDGFILTDSANHNQSLSYLGTIPAGGFVVYEYPKGDGWLNNSAKGDTLTLKFEGAVLDQYSYSGPVAEGVTLGRYPDGAGPFAILSQASRAQANYPPSSPTPLSTQVSPAPSPVLVPTSTHTLPPTKTPSPKPTFTPTPALPPPHPTSTPDLNPTFYLPRSQITEYPIPHEILGAVSEEKVPTPQINAPSPSLPSSLPPWPAIILIVLGSAGILGSAALLLFKKS